MPAIKNPDATIWLGEDRPIILTSVKAKRPFYAASTIVHPDTSNESTLSDPYNTIPAPNQHQVIVQHKNHIAEDVACVGGGFADGSDIEGMFAELEEMDKQSKKKVREVRKKPKTSNRKK